MQTIYATEDQVRKLMELDDGGPIAIINLLKFHDFAAYPSDAPEASLSLTGREAYSKYAEAFENLIAKDGAQSLYWGDTIGYAIGEGEWDAIWVNQFPNLAALRKASADPSYGEMHRHRAAGLSHQEAIATRPRATGVQSLP